jgi:hypothetical protein
MRIPSLAFLGLLVLAGCSSNPIPIGPDQDFTLQLHETGGFFGVNQTTSIDSAKDTITFRPSAKAMVESDRITPAELESVRSAANAAKFSGGPYPCNGCSDQSHFTATVESDSGSAEVEFDAGDSAPEALTQLEEVVLATRDNHFDVTSSP